MELHKLTPALGVLQDLGYKVALVTDGRMSGTSGKVPAAIHLSPEAAGESPIGKLREGDVVSVDSECMTLAAEVSNADSHTRLQWRPDPRKSASVSAARCSRPCAARRRSQQGAMTFPGAA